MNKFKINQCLNKNVIKSKIKWTVYVNFHVHIKLNKLKSKSLKSLKNNEIFSDDYRLIKAIIKYYFSSFEIKIIFFFKSFTLIIKFIINILF